MTGIFLNKIMQIIISFMQNQQNAKAGFLEKKVVVGGIGEKMRGKQAGEKSF